MKLLISDKDGKIFAHPYLEGAGMKNSAFFRLRPEDIIKLPAGSRIFTLPGRLPVGYNSATSKFEVCNDTGYALAAFLPPGFTLTYNSAFRERGNPAMLPLFSYAPLIAHRGGFYTTALRVDKDKRHDHRFIKIGDVRRGIKELRKMFPKNRLIRHLEKCALVNNCPNAQNLFLKRYEAPLPVSPYCNARCAGCISFQEAKACRATQPRIKFIPTPEEIAEIALLHIGNVRKPIVSFGQGCEGEPLIHGDIIEKAIQLIRKDTSRGTINMNTNGSKPEMAARLFDAGLDGIRVSLNSVQKKYYIKYYRPNGYRFEDVLKTIQTAKGMGGFVSINYLTMPGFADSKGEFTAFNRFLRRYKPDMIQWRNLNYDPVRYFNILGMRPDGLGSIGIKEAIKSLKRDFPRLKMGYFNPYASFKL